MHSTAPIDKPKDQKIPFCINVSPSGNRTLDRSRPFANSIGNDDGTRCRAARRSDARAAQCGDKVTLTLSPNTFAPFGEGNPRLRQAREGRARSLTRELASFSREFPPQRIPTSR
jgi:hypothetical protein